MINYFAKQKDNCMLSRVPVVLEQFRHPQATPLVLEQFPSSSSYSRSEAIYVVAIFSSSHFRPRYVLLGN